MAQKVFLSLSFFSDEKQIEIYDVFNGANMDDLCGNCVAFVDDLKDLSDESEGENCMNITG